MSPDTHTHKRPFRYDPHHQQSLTSYFSISSSTSTSTSAPSSSSCSPSISTSVPVPLPPSIQSSLLHLGMRVRKSVGEGYKLQQTPSSLLSKEQTASLPQAHASLRNGYRESEGMGYWGIQRDGGVAPPSEEDLPGLLFPDEEEEEGWPSSQESNSSVVLILKAEPPPTIARKRIWRDDSEDYEYEEEEKTDQNKDELGFSGLHKTPTNGNAAQGDTQLRTLAQPRPHRKRTYEKRAGRRGDMDTRAADFEDAAFFRAEEWMDVE